MEPRSKYQRMVRSLLAYSDCSSEAELAGFLRKFRESSSIRTSVVKGRLDFWFRDNNAAMRSEDSSKVDAT